ncbi:unnamed protein product [Anisakis simplex]|uniref:ShKT domain-containing protein n=1 Tax=Anisakis simplex TaxID=6269 RepID=A0A3P6S036_ANISI|nr:unnamed protein product [Anisakis simplex]
MKNSGEFDRLALLHADAVTGAGAHAGPAFLPWHREYLKRIEIAVRLIDPTLAVPYWDSSMEANLPNAKDSILFTEDFLGSSISDGRVADGPFANWTTSKGTYLRRNVGGVGWTFTEERVEAVMRETRIDQVLAYSAPRRGCEYPADFDCLEYSHGYVHLFVGGDMYSPLTSADDPIFQMHHSFVDHIWELWRIKQIYGFIVYPIISSCIYLQLSHLELIIQTRYERETQYPPDRQQCSSTVHFAAAPMLPFTPFTNIDGLSNKYTDDLYEYFPRSYCTKNWPHCGSRYLFCDLSHDRPQCTSKVKLGGSCTGFTNNEDVCYDGFCASGRCEKPITAGRNAVNVRCGQWALRGECEANEMWMTENCRESCQKCNMTREEQCFKALQNHEPSCNIAPGCYNDYACCPEWGRAGACKRHTSWMSCHCRVTCGFCTPDTYEYGDILRISLPQIFLPSEVASKYENEEINSLTGCDDYHPRCPEWKNIGECTKNSWMLENCRKSCDSCYEAEELLKVCYPSNSKYETIRQMIASKMESKMPT